MKNDAYTKHNDKLADFKGKQKHRLRTLQNTLALILHTFLMQQWSLGKMLEVKRDFIRLFFFSGLRPQDRP